MGKYGKSLVLLFAVPFISLVFFYFAPQWTESKYHSRIEESIQKAQITDEQKTQNSNYFSELSFQGLCSSDDPEAQKLVNELQFESVCRDFTIFDYSFSLAALTLMLSAFFCLVLVRLSRSSIVEGQYNAQKLIRNYRIGWRISLFVVFLSLVFQGILAVALSFYMTSIPTGKYYPQLVLVLGLGAIWGLYQSVVALYKKIPLEFKEVAAQSVSREQAPQLWKLVADISHKVGTAEPHEIVLGMQPMFYVTELSVQHSAGKSVGRTLYLSIPLMKNLSVDELSSIIGHEMGHFKGEDTLLTLELYPMKQKTYLTALGVQQAGLMSIPATHMLNLFFDLFEPILMKVSRDREFLADQAGVQVSSAQNSANALVKAVYYGHVWQLSFQESLMESKPIENFYEKVENDLSQNQDFWKSLSEESQSHPLDTHPPTKARLEKLGISATVEAIRSIAEAKSQTLNSYALLLGDESAKQLTQAATAEYEKLSAEQSNRVKVLHAKAEDDDGRLLLEKNFPELSFLKSKGTQIFNTIAFSVTMVGALLLAFKLRNRLELALLFIAIAFVLLFYFQRFFKFHWNSKLILKYDSLYYEGWVAPLKFDDIETMQVMSNNGIESLNLKLKKKIPNLAKKPLFFKNVKTVSIVISSFQGKNADIIAKIFSYFTRQID
jgi:Zn-dependent protease with chaperone function